MSYEEALAQLQELVKVIEAPDAQIAGVEKELKKAMELLDFCRKELDGYENFANQARDQLTALSVAAKEVSAFAKIPSTISINMSTLVDDSTSKLAELMIDGNTMGVVQMKKELSRVEQGTISDDATKLAEDVVSFQEKNIETMKTFL